MKNTTKNIVESSPSIKANTASYDKYYILSNGGTLNIYGNCSQLEIYKMVRDASSKGGIILIQLAKKFKVSDELLGYLNTIVLEKYPNCGISLTLNGLGAFDDLTFLKHLHNSKRLRINMNQQVDLSPINAYCKLHFLAIGGDKLKIKGISKNKTIEELSVFHKINDVECIAEMTQLKKLDITGMTLKDLSFLKTLTHLKELNFMLGGTKNLESLPDIGKIEKLSFTSVNHLIIENLMPINQMKYLKELHFENQPHLTDLNWLKKVGVQTKVIHCKNFI